MLISLTFTPGYVYLCGVSSHVVVLGLLVRSSYYLCGAGDCDACAVVCEGHAYAERVRECQGGANIGMGDGDVWWR